MTARSAPSLLVPCVVGAAQALVFINHAPLLPLIMPELGMTPAQAARGPFAPRTLILTTLGGTMAALVLLAWPGRPVAVAIAALVVVGVMTTLSYPATIALVGRSQPQAAGAALGVIATVSPAAVVVGAPLTGALLSLTGDFTVPFLALALLPFAALVWGFALPDDERPV